MIKNKKKYKYFLFSLLLLVWLPVYASMSDGTIDATNYTTLLCINEDCTTNSQINWKTTNGTVVHILDTTLTGKIWSENNGWINLNPTLAGVTNTRDGVLGGYAWGENTGWINFAPTNGGVTINTLGEFSGWAWAENTGWIKFDCSVTNACLKTDWRPISVRPKTSGNLPVTLTPSIPPPVILAPVIPEPIIPPALPQIEPLPPSALTPITPQAQTPDNNESLQNEISNNSIDFGSSSGEGSSGGSSSEFASRNSVFFAKTLGDSVDFVSSLANEFNQDILAPVREVGKALKEGVTEMARGAYSLVRETVTNIANFTSLVANQIESFFTSLFGL